MRDLASPLANRGPEALQSLITGDRAHAHAQVRLLTLSELSDLETAAEQLIAMSRRYTHRQCETCGGAVVWFMNEPTRQQKGWRHVDLAAALTAAGQHHPALASLAETEIPTSPTEGAAE